MKHDMKVICINADGWLLSDETCSDNGGFELENGKVYTVTNVFIANGYCWYVLKEDSDSTEENELGWSSERFISHKAIIDKINSLEKHIKSKNWLQKLFS